MSNIKIDDLSNQIASTLKEYTTEVEEGIESEKKKVAKAGVETLKATSPKSHAKGKHYANGWGTVQSGKAIVIRNKTKPQLTHLLEKGHAKVGGGRVPGIPHIGPAETQVINAYTAGVERLLK